jgi:hypothetical protein
MKDQKTSKSQKSFNNKPLTPQQQRQQKERESNQQEIARNNPKIDNNVVRGYN